MDSLSPYILHQAMPEPRTGYTYLGLLVLEVMSVVFDFYRGINH